MGANGDKQVAAFRLTCRAWSAFQMRTTVKRLSLLCGMVLTVLICGGCASKQTVWVERVGETLDGVSCPEVAIELEHDSFDSIFDLKFRLVVRGAQDARLYVPYVELEGERLGSDSLVLIDDSHPANTKERSSEPWWFSRSYMAEDGTHRLPDYLETTGSESKRGIIKVPAGTYRLLFRFRGPECAKSRSSIACVAVSEEFTVQNDSEYGWFGRDYAVPDKQ